MREDEYGDYRFVVVVDGDYIEIVEKSYNKTVGEISYSYDTDCLVVDYYQTLSIDCILATSQWLNDHKDNK